MHLVTMLVAIMVRLDRQADVMISWFCKAKSRLDGEMKIVRLSLICIFLTTSAFGQLTARNPVDELKDQVIQALADAQVPLTSDQERQLVLLIEVERQAAENLFGETWDFSHGDFSEFV